MATKPTKRILDWASSGTKTDPGAAKEAAGWLTADRPPSQWWNWALSSFGDWLTYFSNAGPFRVVGYKLGFYHYDFEKVSVTSQDTAPFSAALNADGTSFYMVGGTNDTIYQYNMTTPYDPTTATYASKSFLTTTQTSAPYYCAWGDSGDKFYIQGNTIIYQYTATTPYDLGSISYASKSYDTTTQTTTPNGFCFNPDGSQFFIADLDDAYGYNLGTNWDISTATYDSGVTALGNGTAPRGMGISDDGKRAVIYQTTNDALYQYTLSTAWDISTATYDSVTVDTSGLSTGTPVGANFSTDGAQAFMTRRDSDEVHRVFINQVVSLDLG